MKVTIVQPKRIDNLITVEQGAGSVLHVGEVPRSPANHASGSSARARNGAALGALCDLLGSLFDLDQLRTWLTFRGYEETVDQLPTGQTSLRQFCFATVAQLDRVGAVTAHLFDTLVADFPRRAEHIDEVRAKLLTHT